MVLTVANTPLRSFRISDQVYAAAQAVAEAKGISVTELIVSHLEMLAKADNIEVLYRKAQNG